MGLNKMELSKFNKDLATACEAVAAELRKYHFHNIKVEITRRGYEVVFCENFINPKTDEKFIGF